MTTPPPDSAKLLANQLATRLMQVEDLPRLLDSMRQLGFFNGRLDLPAEHASPLPALAVGDGSQTIGIWEPVVVDGQRHYRRGAVDPFTASRWAATETIPVKSDKKRIVYLGESVARGFFFEPHFTPALAMETMLAGEGSATGYEVIDLACNGQFMPALFKLAHDALAMEPDLFIVFAGNNLLEPNALWQEMAPNMAQALRRGEGVAGINRVIESWLVERVHGILDHLVKLAESQRVPVLLVIPEFNLVDFGSDSVAGAPLMRTPEAHTLWQQVWDEAQTRLQQEDWVACETIAARLRELDDGTTSHAWHLTARCQMARGDMDGARASLEQARDAMLWSWPLLTPRRPRVIREAILAAQERIAPHVTIIDLAERMQVWRDGALPDREIFFDYCHLSFEGISMAAAEMARWSRKILDGVDADWATLVARSPRPDATIISRAHLFATLHNASWGQSQEIVRHHAEKASQSPEMLKLATLMGDLACRCLPGALCDIFPEVLALDDPLAVFRMADMGERRHDRVIEALSLAFTKHDPLLAERLKEQLIVNHGPGAGPMDLLEPYRHINNWCQPGGEWHKSSTFFSSHTEESEFVLHLGA
ncbi:MAG: SGNH/GDSL hydrolase family protein, partial [Magnetococcales bacterium]|nr:SGNH/GDSL hydrolase family protein [Magnetococcales bacterium]